MTRRLLLIAALAFSIVFWCAISVTALAAEPLPKITGWVHIFGCPRMSKDDDTNNDIIVVFVDGQVAHLKQHALSDDQKGALAKMLTMPGLNIVYDCGTQS